MKGAHLWKRILNEGFVGDYVFEDDSNESVLNRVITSTIFVCPIEFKATDLHRWTQMSGIAIPFIRLWIEGNIPHEIGEMSRWGALVESSGIEGGTNIRCHNFWTATGYPVRLEGCGDFNLDKKGSTTENIVRAHCNEDRIEKLGKHAANICTAYAGLTCDFLMLLGCKNVSITPNDNDPKQVRRAIKRHGGTPESYRYHTLVVRPPGAKSDSPGIEIGIMPRHVARGHFAEYGPYFGKGLLFGKYAGRFFIPAHLRGRKENGIVEKDYLIPGNGNLEMASQSSPRE